MVNIPLGGIPFRQSGDLSGIRYRERPVARMTRPPVLLALLGVLALVAMHGVSAHGLEAGGHDDAPEVAVTAVAIAAWSTSSDAAPDDGHGSHHHDHGGAPCPSCAHGAAALCALIVLGVAVVARRATRALAVRAPLAPRPPLRHWSPDPPVPRFGLVPTTA